MSELVEREDGETVVEAPAHVIPPTRHEQTKAARGARLWTWIARVTGLALLAAVLGFGIYLAVVNASARAERQELITQLDEERAKVDALYEQLRSVGEDPVVEPGKSDDSNPPAGVGPVGPQGVPGDDGDPGRPPTAEEVAAAINAFCAANAGCRGPAGTNGTNGTNGESIVGPAGPAGADGAPGAPGLPGMNGVSVLSVSCVVRDDLSTAFRFTFTDGEFSDVAGACLP